jgi:hypothetical protein
MRLVRVVCMLVWLAGSFALAQNPVPFLNQPLVPASVTPGSTTFTLTVNGTGFVSGATINWNGTALVTTFVSSSQLTATVPSSNVMAAGTAAITVKNPGSPSSQSLIFETTNPVSAVGFARTDLSGGDYCPSVTADFNGDGKLDLLQCGQNQYTVLLGNGDGTFTPLTPVSLPQSLGDSVVGNLNSDGKLDVVSGGACCSLGGITILLGNGDGTFQSPATIPGDPAVALALGDFNGDGRLDLAVGFVSSAEQQPDYILIFLGNGNGTFQSGISYSLPDQAQIGTIAVGDFNQDNRLDLGVATNDGTFLMLGNGDGSFQSPQAVAAASNYPAAATADLNGDGKLDLVVTTASAVGVLLGNGDGTFGTETTFAAPTFPTSILISDMNGDGKPDLIVSSYDSVGGPLSIFLGNGDGTFQAYSDFPISSEGLTVFSIGDFNQDGKLDLMANTGIDSVLLQTTVSLPIQPLNFGSQDDNTTSNPQTVTFTNLASSALQINSIQIVRMNQGDFAIQSNTCGSSLGAGQSCAVGVTFTPAAKGARSASLQFNDNAPGSPQSVGLMGTGIGTNPPAVSLSPTSLTFPGQAVGVTSAPMILTLTNTGDLTLDINGIVFVGADPGDFGETNDCGDVIGGSQCTISVTFTPTAQGARSATLNIFDNASNSPQAAPVNGTGVPPGLGLGVPSGSSNSATVSAGSTAKYTLAIGGGGISGTASLTCTGAPAKATCTVPGSESVSATSASTFTVSVSTTAPSSATLQRRGWSFTWFWATALIGMVWLPVSRRSWSLARRTAAISSLLLVTFLVSCGGGGGGNGGGSGSPSGGTPAGTYTLTVKAAMGSTTQSQTLKLRVQ